MGLGLGARVRVRARVRPTLLASRLPHEAHIDALQQLVREVVLALVGLVPEIHLVRVRGGLGLGSGLGLGL